MRHVLERSLFIPRPRPQVFAFFADARNLERITPALLRFHILTPGPIEMKAGVLIDYQLRLYGLPVRWRTRIDEFTPPFSFVDVQLSGPYRSWHHRHQFAEVPGGTRMHDRVEYDLPFGPLGALAHTLLVRRTLNRIFDHRNSTISAVFR